MNKKELKKILYVEDDVDIQKIVSMALEDIGGYELKICSSGQEALAEAEAFNPDLFLLDVMVPEMSGPQLLLVLRKNKKFKNIPAIFISAIAEGPELIPYRKLGAIGMIRKPFDPIILSNTIEVLYQSSHVMQENISQMAKLEEQNFSTK